MQSFKEPHLQSAASALSSLGFQIPYGALPYVGEQHHMANIHVLNKRSPCLIKVSTILVRIRSTCRIANANMKREKYSLMCRCRCSEAHIEAKS